MRILPVINLQKIYPQLFDRNVRACFKGAKATIEGDRFVVHCGQCYFTSVRWTAFLG